MREPAKRLLTLVAALACAAFLAAGCGDDDGGGGDGGGDSIGPIQSAPGNDTGSDDRPDSKEEGIDSCYEEADKLEGQARETARAACKAADTGETQDFEDELKRQCVESTKSIPDEATRKRAEEACESAGN